MKNHYDIPGRGKQPIELMRLGLTEEEFEGYCIGNVMKYILRYKHKGGDNDLYKAREHIDFLIRSYNPDPILGDDEEGRCYICEGGDDEEEVCGVCQNKMDHNMFVPPRRNEDDEEDWRRWACQNNRNLDRVVTRTYKE